MGIYKTLYFQSINKRNSGHRWLIQLIKRSWQIAWDLWDYRNDIAYEANLRQHHIALSILIQTELQSTVPPTASHLLSADHPLLKLTPTPYQKQAWLTKIQAHKTFAQHQRPSTDPALSQMQQLAYTLYTLLPIPKPKKEKKKKKKGSQAAPIYIYTYTCLLFTFSLSIFQSDGAGGFVLFNSTLGQDKGNSPLNNSILLESEFLQNSNWNSSRF